jgi:hypothetical protein
MVYVNIKTDITNREKLRIMRDCGGYADFNSLISSFNIIFSLDILRKGLEYVKNHGKSQAILNRVKTIYNEINNLLAKNNSEEERIELLKLKVVCEEYLR